MRHALQRCRQASVLTVLALSLGLAVPAAAGPVSLEVRDGVEGQPIVRVSAEEFPDPNGVRYLVTTTLGDGTAARTLRVSVTRKRNQWLVDPVDGLKGGTFKKVAGLIAKGGAAASKRFKGWAKLAPTPEERAALTARGKAVQAEMRDDGKEIVAAVNAAPSFDPKDLAVAQMAIALRYYDWLYATLDAVKALGPKSKSVNPAITSALDALYPRGNAGQCTAAPSTPTYRMDSEDCPPSDFVPFSEVALSQECYGKRGLYQDNDFKCSAGAPQGTAILTASGWTAVDFRECCLEHDRAFFCGGVTTSGQATGSGPGSWEAWQQANGNLVSCIGQSILEGYAATSTAPNFLLIGAWQLYFSFTGNIFIWGDSTLVGDAWANGWNDPSILDRRLDTCLCGGDQPVPLCENHCMVNRCSAPPPALLDEPAFENLCENTCMWTCVEEYEDGELTKRYRRKRVFDAAGNVVDTGNEYDFSSCTPQYEMSCDCDPYQRPNPPGAEQCELPTGFFAASGLPTSQNVSLVDP